MRRQVTGEMATDSRRSSTLKKVVGSVRAVLKSWAEARRDRAQRARVRVQVSPSHLRQSEFVPDAQ
jgi:hypothetical protein